MIETWINLLEDYNSTPQGRYVCPISSKPKSDLDNIYSLLKEILMQDTHKPNIRKEESNMLKIKDYKYITNNGVTIITWSDGTQTKVVHDPETADQFTGFCAAIAKKAMGNGGKMLAEWERLVIKPIEDAEKAERKAREEVEKLAERQKLLAESKARRDAKKAEHQKKREIEALAREYADWYRENEIREAALNLAAEKYGVPRDYFKFDDNREYFCKEFDVLNENDEE